MPVHIRNRLIVVGREGALGQPHPLLGVGNDQSSMYLEQMRLLLYSFEDTVCL